MKFFNHLEILFFQEIAEIVRLMVFKAPQSIFLIILKLTTLTPELLFISSETNTPFNSFTDKESFMAFTLLIYVLIVIGDFGVFLANF